MTDPAPLLEVLRSPARRQILRETAREPHSVTGLARLVKISQPTSTRHVAALAALGLVTTRPLGSTPGYPTEVRAEVGELNRQLAEMLSAVHPYGLEEVVFLTDKPDEVQAWPGMAVAADAAGK